MQLRVYRNIKYYLDSDSDAVKKTYNKIRLLKVKYSKLYKNYFSF